MKPITSSEETERNYGFLEVNLLSESVTMVTDSEYLEQTEPYFWWFNYQKNEFLWRVSGQKKCSGGAFRENRHLNIFSHHSDRRLQLDEKHSTVRNIEKSSSGCPEVPGPVGAHLDISGSHLSG